MAKILGVDDSPEVLQQLNALLSSYGHEFLFIAKPDFLFNRLQDEEFDLVLLDLNMPGSNGMDLLSSMKKHKEYNHIPVIMITADTDVDSLQKCFELGASDFISKPINEIVLKTRINAVLEIKEKIDEIMLNQEKIKLQELEIERQQTLQFQLRSLSTMMDPHFIFNSLNSIQYYVLENDIDKAIEFISDFSGLMRISLNNSTKELISLTDEIEFLEAYLKVESKRFNGRLKYEVDVAKELKDDIYKIPPMLIQPYVENAIVHGIQAKEGNGNIRIQFYLKHRVIVCEVVDDGIGRTAAETYKSAERLKNHKSYGMGVTNVRLELLNVLEKKSFSVSILDLEKAGDPAGTKVSITFPADL